MTIPILLAATVAYLATCAALAYALSHRSKGIPMPIIEAFQPTIDALNAAATSLNTSAQTIATNAANPVLPAGAADAQDVTDTASALTTASDSVTASAAAVAAALAPPAAPEG